MTRKETFVGLDGYPKGWVAVWLFPDRQEIEYIPNVDALLLRNFTRALIDMPIGLPEKGYRDCDIVARSLLGKNATRVFLGARRFILACKDQPTANVVAKSLQDKGVSAQLFCLSEKLRQVDDVLTNDTQERIMECHPELVFLRLNSHKPVPKKKLPEGQTIRIKLLEEHGFKHVREWVAKKPPKVKPDDILDACACALAAREMNSRIGSGTDSKGLRMEIHY